MALAGIGNLGGINPLLGGNNGIGGTNPLQQLLLSISGGCSGCGCGCGCCGGGGCSSCGHGAYGRSAGLMGGY